MHSRNYQISITTALMMTINSALAAPMLDIKGIHASMSQFELMELHGKLPLENFTIAGVPSMHTYIDPEFLDGKLQRFEFYFSSRHFDELAAVVKRKIPLLKCSNSPASTIIGKSITQTSCIVQGKDGDLTLVRYLEDVTTSALILRSSAEIKKSLASQKKAKDDI